MEIFLPAAKILAASGFSIWDIFEENSTITTITFENNSIDKAVTGSEYGVGLRGVKDYRTYYGSTNDPALAQKIAASLGAASKTAKEYSFREISPSVKHPVRTAPESVAVAEKTGLLRKLNDQARAGRDHVKQATFTYMEKRQKVRIINDLGILANDERVYTTLVMMIIAEKNGRIETGYEVISGHAGWEILEQDVLKRVDTVCNTAKALLETEEKIAGEMTAVLSSSAGGTMIHEAVGHSLEADLVQKDMSCYKGKKGQKVATGIITVVDDATLPNKRGSFAFDDEGTPAQKTVLIENGMLKNFIYDRVSALRDNTSSTGSGRRESYEHRPIPRMRNTMIAPGSGKAEELIKDTKSGIYIKKMGGGQVNTVTGEFIFEVKEAYKIENGKVTVPVRDATLMGKGPDVLNTIDAVCDDIGFDVGTCGKDGQGVPVSDAQPTLRIPKILVGSK